MKLKLIKDQWILNNQYFIYIVFSAYSNLMLTLSSITSITLKIFFDLEWFLFWFEFMMKDWINFKWTKYILIKNELKESDGNVPHSSNILKYADKS